MGAVDARKIVSVQDVHGGVTIYYQGRPPLYFLAGEWCRALPDGQPSEQEQSTAGSQTGR